MRRKQSGGTVIKEPSTTGYFVLCERLTVLTQGRTLPAPHLCSVTAGKCAPPLIEGIEPIQKGVLQL